MREGPVAKRKFCDKPFPNLKGHDEGNVMVEGHIFNIQRFSTHDGQGVRTTVFLKGCPLHCFWCHNPESQPEAPVLMYNETLCTGCGRCAAVCPHHAVMIRDGKARVDRELCAACGRCGPSCPAKARSVAGRTITAEEAMNVIRRDIPLFENSGGGVTVSGGEPTMQPAFVEELLTLCREEGIHTAIETCGYVRWDVLERLLPLLDFVFFDVKMVDGAKHKQGTGVDNALILDNARRIAGKKPMCIRMPLIPGFNDDDGSVRALGNFVGGTLGLGYRDVELLKYNNLGESKTLRMGREKGESLQPQTEERMNELNGLLKRAIEESRI